MTDESNEERPFAMDMNGNPLREGDLVMVLLEKPNLVGFITEVKVPSLITAGDKNQQKPGVMTVTGKISIPFNPLRTQVLLQTAKLVNPAATSFVDNIIDKLRGPAGSKPAPTLTFHKPNESGAEPVKQPDPTSATPVPTTEQEGTKS